MAYWVTTGVSFNCSAVTSPVVKTSPSTVVKINNTPIYVGNIDVIIPSGATQGGGVLTAPVTITLSATSAHSISENKKVLLDTATGTATGTFQVGQSSTSLPITLSIASAGQTIVKE